VSKKNTPKVDELESGPWPSFVKEIKKSADNPMAADLLGVLERSYNEKVGHWKHGGLVGVKGYGGGVIGRYSDLPSDFPEAAEFHTVRINPPAGWFYTSDVIRQLCDIWEKHGSGLTNFHGATGDAVFLGAKTGELEPLFDELLQAGFDLGGSGSALRTPSCCAGKARCEWACFDTMDVTHELTQSFQDEMHRPAFPYKFKIKASGCPNDCVGAIARSDLSIIGTWRDDIEIDRTALGNYVASGKPNILSDIVDRCPTRCMRFEDGELSIDNDECAKCMHCINALPLALAPGKDRGAMLLVGGKAPILHQARVALRRHQGAAERHLGPVVRARQAPRTRRRVHPAHRARQLPRADRTRSAARDGGPPTNEPLHRPPPERAMRQAMRKTMSCCESSRSV
jgi:sulfite reductase alpha subunit